ncbi:MAG TPA: twin-arginine translocase subunit TatC [Acidimicrobiales bacterium]|nr:twin-arginine translocase subunit TatC [Acidimicrobiales bacterium]
MTTTSERPAVDDAGLARMTLVEHLAELRNRLVKAVLAVTVAAVIVFVLYDRILTLLIAPYKDITGQADLTIFSPLEGIAARLKVAGYGGLFVASPVVLWQLWRFITPGLHPKEKRYAIPFLLSSIFLFLVGAAVAILTFPKALQFLISISGQHVQTLFGPERYVTFLLKVILAFGVAFEFPILLVFLQLANIITSRRLLKSWRGAVVFIFAFAAVITPSQDPWSLFAMAIPMTIFFFAAIGIGRLLKR